MRMRVLVLLIVGASLLQASESALATVGISEQTTFNPSGQDSTFSLGQFEIVLNPSFSGAVAAAVAAGNFPLYDPTNPDNGGYDPTTNRFWSPLLFDQSTLIGRSSAVELGTNSSSSAVSVVNSGLTVGSNASGLTVSPSQPGSATYPYPPGYVQPTATTDAVFTNINSFNLQGTGIVTAGSSSNSVNFAVTTGAAASDPNLPASAGRVTSLAGMGGSPQANDFPASSFFDVYVDVSVQGLGTLTNATVGGTQGDPLIITSSSISAFPPTVVYEHGNSTAVPILFESGPYVGQTLGLLTLAGHGINYTDPLPGYGTPAEFNAAIASMTEMPVLPQYASWGTPSDPLTVVPEPTTISLLAIFAGGTAVASCLRRRLRKA